MATVSKNLPLCTHRYALFVSYIGTRYKGSQRLINRESTGEQDTIQEALEAALDSCLPKEKCRLTAGSRTDRGVHSLMSCYTLPLIDFKCTTERMKRTMNLNLLKRKHEIVVNEVFLAPASFHPRKDAVSREYIYRVGIVKNHKKLNNYVGPSKFSELFGAFPASELFRLLPLPTLDVDKAEEVADLLRGEHDFATFSHQTTKDDDTVRTLEIDILPEANLTFNQDASSLYDIYTFRFKSRAFLYNQIRRIMGTILSYASFDRVGLDGIKKLLDEPDSQSWPEKLPIAEPWGLYLSRINYGRTAFQGSKWTYDDKTEAEIPMDSIPGLTEVSDDHEN